MSLRYPFPPDIGVSNVLIAPAVFRRRAIGRVPVFDTTAGLLEYPLRQNTRLQVSIIREVNGVRHVTKNSPRIFDESQLEDSLRAAQAEVVQQEIFSVLIREASSLPTASVRVSERLIAIEAAQATELRFELVRILPSSIRVDIALRSHVLIGRQRECIG